MGITTSASLGIRVNSAAKDSNASATVLASQTAAASDGVIVPAAITTNNEGNLVASPVYPGRLIMLRHRATHVDTMVVAGGGTGHAVGDIIPMSGGTAARQMSIRVLTLSGSAIATAKIHEAGDAGSPGVTVGFDRGEYSVEPGNPVSQGTSSGAGTGATFTLTFKGAEEVRYINADASLTLTVHEGWIDGPAQNQNWRVCYIVTDLATVNGIGLASKRVDDFVSTRRTSIGDGVLGTFGWFALLDGVSLETSAEGTGTTGPDFDGTADFQVREDSRFDVGYLAGGVPTGGASMFFAGGAGTADGDGVFVIDPACDQANLFNFFCKGVNSYEVGLEGNCLVQGSTFFGTCFDFHTDSSNSGRGTTRIFKDIIVEDRGGEFDFIVGERDDGVLVDGIVIANTAGFRFDTLQSVYTAEVRNAVILGNNQRFIEVPNAAFIFRVVNPVWSPDRATEGDLVFGSTTLGLIQELFQLSLTVTDVTSTAIDGAIVKVVENLLNDEIPNDGVTDSTGFFTVDILKENLTPDGGTDIAQETFGDFALHVNNYGDVPFFGILLVEDHDIRSVALGVDPATTEASQATAITNGSGIEVSHQLSLPYDAQTVNYTLGLVVTGAVSGAFGTIIVDTDAGGTGTLILELVTGVFEDDELLTDSGSGSATVTSATGGTNLSYKAIGYDNGTGSAPTLGETMTVANSGADTTGEVVDFEGDGVSGILLLENWNGIAPENNVLITGGTSTFSADSDTVGGTSVDEEYFWMINANNKTMAQTYDYLSARMAEDTLVDPFTDVHIWGEDEHAAIFFFGAGGYFTQRNINRTQGVWIRNRGAGDIDFFTSDGGIEVTPPISINLTLTGMRDNTEVRICDAATGAALAGVENATDGSSDDRSVTFGLNAGILVDIRFAHGIAADGNVYTVPDRNSIVDFTWPSSTTSLPITQVLDRSFFDPA